MITQTISPFPPVPNPATDSSSEFEVKAANYVEHQAEVFASEVNTLVEQINVAQDELSSLAAGEVYGLRYVFSATTAEADPTAGKLRLNNAAPASATELYLSETDRFAVGMAATIATWDDNAQASKGRLRIIKATEATTFVEYSVVDAITDNGGWVSLNLQYVNRNGAFADGDPVVLYFERYGEDGSDAEFTSPTRAIATNGAITSADNGYLLDVTAAGVTLTLDSAAALGSGWSCMLLESAYAVTLSGTFGGGVTSKKLMPRGAYLLNSDGTSHRVTRVGGAAATGQCVFKTTSATACRLDPCDGDRIVVGGKEMQIPLAGTVVSNGGLAANTAYYAYAYDNAGTLALEFSATAPTNASSGLDAWGNRNKAGDTTRTLVGYVRTNASSQFVDSASQRFVRSWFNDEGLSGAAILSATTAASAASFTELPSAQRAELLTWAGETVTVYGGYTGYDAGGGTPVMSMAVGYDGLGVQGRTGNFVAPGSSQRAASFDAVIAPAEGYHFLQMMIFTSGGTTPTWMLGSTGFSYVTKRR